MKYFRLSLVAGILTLALAISTFAGDMQTTRTVATAGQIEIPYTVAMAGEMDTTVTSVSPMMEIALTFIHGVLPLF